MSLAFVSFIWSHSRSTLRKPVPPLLESWRKMGKKRSVTPNGDAVRSARLRKAWTTDDLAGRADCAVKTIENAERGKAIYANTLALIARALDVEYDSLIARPVEEKKQTEVEQTKSAEHDRQVLFDFQIGKINKYEAMAALDLEYVDELLALIAEYGIGMHLTGNHFQSDPSAPPLKDYFTEDDEG